MTFGRKLGRGEEVAMETGNTKDTPEPGKSSSYWEVLGHSAEVILEQHSLVLMNLSHSGIQ